MPILIQYRNNTFSVVSKSELDALIDSKEIIAFRRSGGWIDISKGPLRGQGAPQHYRGQERREGQMPPEN